MTPGVLWMTPAQAWGGCPRSKQWFLFGRWVGRKGVNIWIAWSIFTKLKMFRPPSENWIRISGRGTEKEYGSPDHSNVSSLLWWKASFIYNVPLSKEKEVQEEKERINSQGKGQIMSTKGESLYEFYNLQKSIFLYKYNAVFLSSFFPATIYWIS